MTSEAIRDPKADHLLTPQNSAFIIIDYQPVQVNSIASMDRQLLLNNIADVGVGWGAFWQNDPAYLRTQWDDLVPLLESGALQPPIGSRHPLDDVAAALVEIDERRAVGKVVVLPR